MTEHIGESIEDIVNAIESSDEHPANLIAKLMSVNLRDYQHTTSCLIEGYQQQIADLEAVLGAIRHRINDLFGGDYMPTESAIMRAVFYPEKSLVEKCRKVLKS